MSLKNIINRSLEVAWKQLKDLAVPAVLHKSAAGGFDFSTGEASATSSSVPVKVVLIDGKVNKATPLVTPNVTGLFKFRETGDVSHYDELHVGPQKYRVSKPQILNDGFLVTVVLEKI